MKKVVGLTLLLLAITSNSFAEINIDQKKIYEIRNQFASLASDNSQMESGAVSGEAHRELNGIFNTLATMVESLDALNNMVSLHYLSSDKQSSETIVKGWVKRIQFNIKTNLKYLNEISTLGLNNAVLNNLSKTRDYLHQTETLLADI